MCGRMPISNSSTAQIRSDAIFAPSGLCLGSGKIPGERNPQKCKIKNSDNIYEASSQVRKRNLVEIFVAYMVTLYREAAALTDSAWCGVIGHIDGHIYDRWRKGSHPREFQSKSFWVDLESIDLAIEECSSHSSVSSSSVTFQDLKAW
jgi:hypothetical protein